MLKNKKIIAIFGLTAAVIFAAAIFALHQPPEQSDSKPEILLPETEVNKIAVNNITGPPEVTKVTDIEPDAMPTIESHVENITATV